VFAVLGEARRAVHLRSTSNPEAVPGQKSVSGKLQGSILINALLVIQGTLAKRITSVLPTIREASDFFFGMSEPDAEFRTTFTWTIALDRDRVPRGAICADE
jgi:hypothetical protein